MRITSILMAIAVAGLMSTSPACAVDTDGDGLLDLLDVPGFSPGISVSARYAFLGIEDLDGANQLANLESLYLGGNQITSLESGDFDGLSNLQRLELGGNQITSIESGDFDGLTNLQWLGLGGNQITSLESGDFDGLTNLQELDLPHNPITNLESGAFYGLPNLTELDLKNHQITSLESGAFEGLDNLRALRFSGLYDEAWLANPRRSPLTSIESGAFRGLNNVQRLDLKWNQITSLESGDFDGLSNLQSLDLEGSEITTIESGDFHGLTNLQHLVLHSNQITSIERGAFDGLNNLQELHLADNRITSIESGTFHGLNNLTELGLAGNKLTSLESGAFHGLTNLQSLGLEENQITSLENGAFSGMAHLETLDLGGSGNDITELNFTGATFESLIHLEVDRFHARSLALDDAALSLASFNNITASSGLITDVSLVGLRFPDENPVDFSNLLDIDTLDNVTISQTLFDLYADEFNAFDAMDGNTVTVVPDLGDYNANGMLDAGDLDLQAAAIQSGVNPQEFDLTYDKLVDVDDRARWVHDLKQTYFGDVDLDGDFDSTDLSNVLAAGQYEDGIDLNSSWEAGDFNADGDFDSSDLSMALADGGYEKGPLLATAAVPEPSSVALLCIGLIAVAKRFGQ